MSLIERVQKFDCATPTFSETAVQFHEAEADVGKIRPRGSREQALGYLLCKPKESDEVALQQLPSYFAISFEARMA